MMAKILRTSLAQSLCGTCEHECKRKVLHCGSCERWFHVKCERLIKKQLVDLSEMLLDFIGSICCKTGDEFDYGASLSRLCALSKAKASLLTAAKREVILMRHLHTIPVLKVVDSAQFLSERETLLIIQKTGGLQGKQPAFIKGDGNCLFTSLSVATAGNTQLRYRLRLECALELICNKEFHKGVHMKGNLQYVSPSYRKACKDAILDGAYASS